MAQLQSMLASGVTFAPCYLPSNNSDHLPMTLCAMSGLGASDDVLRAYRDDYQRILHTRSPAVPLANWQQGLGIEAQYSAVLEHFLVRLADGEPGTKLIREVLPEVISSIAMEAFHPLIRLAYAIDFESPREMAAALAYLITSHQPIPIAHTRVDIRAVLEAQVVAGSKQFSRPGFSGNIRELVEQASYPLGQAADLHSCARAAIAVYRATRNFFALHMVTATQAVRICSQFVDEDLALAALTGSLCAAHQVVGSPAFSEIMPMPDRIDREHAYKYAWVCASEYRHFGDAVYAEELSAMQRQGVIADWVTVDLSTST